MRFGANRATKADRFASAWHSDRDPLADEPASPYGAYGRTNPPPLCYVARVVARIDVVVPASIRGKKDQ